MSSPQPHYLFVHSRFPCLSETFVVAQAESLARMGVPVCHIANRRPAFDEVHPPMRPWLERVLYLQSQRLSVWVRAHRWAIERFARRYWQTLAETLRYEAPLPTALAHWAGAVLLLYHFRGQRVHVHAHFTYGAAAVAHWCHRLADVPYSLTLHGSDALYDNPPDLARKLAAAEALVSISAHNLAVLGTRFPGLLPRNRAVIPLGVEPLPYQPPPPIARPLRLLNVGRLSEHKAQHVLIAACAQLREKGVPFLCDIIGSGEREAALRAQIAQAGLGDVVRLLGAKFHDEILASYRRYHVFVLTSVVEGMPLVLMEAINAGIPIVTTAVGAIPELVGPEGALLVPPEDPDAVAEAILRIAEGKIDSARMTQAAHARLTERFDLRRNHACFAEWLRAQPTALIPQ